MKKNWEGLPYKKLLVPKTNLLHAFLMKSLTRNSYCFDSCKLMSSKWNEAESLICPGGGVDMVNLWCFSVLFKESCKKKNEFSKRPSRCQWIILIKIWYEKDMIMEICFVIACSCRVCTQNYCKLTNYSKSLQNGLLINKPILLIEIENCPLSRVLFSFSVQSDSVFF